MRKLLRRQQGFTLLELLIVIVIIGILALIIVPGLASGPKRARDAQRKSDMRAVKNALETYYNDNNAYPAGDYAGLSAHLVTAYIPSMPADPKSGNPAYVYTPVPSGCAAGACTSYVLDATLENTKDSQIKAGTTNTYEVTSTN
ncbi:MAG TPA: prepilin-type N-terminal cleavage/methylation domain-containing protein [Candidatus Saccharimonadales bacterium]|nr:prepilin-type N-terminal cleavage/methylation domain-containing protein [Candidatus Saccharimonadales bacterium]